MPRPGPRPYECIGRAWHSERHQPMRGSLIQDIFRVVSEIHSTATKKNKEWQEKLPVVVLKSEEILYSKANSEAEYTDLKTLLDRTNDAINTIIRWDESTETGELLPSCIEAALNLGCMTRRTARSQRCNNPRCYLYTGIEETSNITQGNHSVHSQGMATCSPFMKQMMSATQNLAPNTDVCAYQPPIARQNVLPSNRASSSIYPFYYGTGLTFEEISHGPAAVNAFHDSLSVNPSTNIAQRYIRGTPDNPHDIGCDLSLRLGPSSVPCPSIKHDQQEQVEEVASSSPEEKKICDLALQMSKQILLVPTSSINDPLDTSSGQWSAEGDVGTNMRKRKAVSAQTLEDDHFGWQPKLPCSQLTGRMNSGGS